jgi:hypothetical protein
VVFHPNPNSHPPALIESLAVWGWAVGHGRIPLAYAAGVLAEHSCYLRDSGVPDPTGDERRTWAAEDLARWEDVVAEMAWPGDAAVDEERWDQPGDWRLREFLLRRLDVPDSPETTHQLLLRHCHEQIAECERLRADQPDTHTDEGI